MASSTLDSEAAFVDRARKIGVDEAYIQKFVLKKFATFGRYAFSIAYSPHQSDETPLINFLTNLLEEMPGEDQVACLRRLFFECHTAALTDVRQRVESSPDPSQATRKLPTAERVFRQKEQEARLGGIIFNPDTIPANYVVDSFVEMCELGVLTYIKAEACCSRAQEVAAIKRDPTVSTDSSGLLKVGTKQSDPTCETNSELKLRAAWQRRSLAMDLAGLSTFNNVETWVQFLFSHLMRDQPRGFSRITLQQIMDCDKQLFTQISHMTMGKLVAGPGDPKPFDVALAKLKDSTEVLQYLTPLPAVKVHDPPPAAHPRPAKTSKNETKGSSKGNKIPNSNKQQGSAKTQLPEGCVTHDGEGLPLCFGFQNGKCKFKGPPGKRCARGYHKCYKSGCFRPKPFYLCNHTD